MVPKHHFLPRGSQGLKVWLGKTCRTIYYSHGIPTSIKVRKLHFGDSCTLPVEKAMAAHSSTLAWKIPWTEEPGKLQSMGSLSWTRLHFHFSLSCTREGNGNPLQGSCLENPREPGGLPSMGSHRVRHD